VATLRQRSAIAIREATTLLGAAIGAGLEGSLPEMERRLREAG
jgi:hypothetical protein